MNENRLRLVSHFPGRLRVRSETFRILEDVAGAVAQRIREEPGVSRVDSSALTGSLLIVYEPSVIQLPRIVDLLVRVGGLHGLELEAGTDVTGVPRPGVKIRELLDTWDRVVQRASKGNVDLRSALPGALAAAGVGVFLFGRRRTPEWYDLIFWSFVTFVNLNPTR